MVRAAITPSAETQRIAMRWMRKFFEVQGDHSPNSDETQLQIMLKADVYKKYCKDMDSQKRPTVQQQRFHEIWKVLFPLVRKRPYCDIPGKCETCYEIDRLRRQENDIHTSRMLQDAHLMHRGGMFHIEREGYVRT